MGNGILLTTKKAKEIRVQVDERLKNPQTIQVKEGMTSLDLFCLFTDRINALSVSSTKMEILLGGKEYKQVSIAEWTTLIESLNGI